MNILYFLCLSLYSLPENPKISTQLDGLLATLAPTSQVKVWVFFTDKGILKEADYKESVKAMEQSLTPRARARRLKVRQGGELCDFSDLPVCKKYVDELKDIGCDFKLGSKFLNAVSVVVEASKITSITNLPYVRKIEQVQVAYASTDATRVIEEKGINYGSSLRQLTQVNIPETHKMGYTGQDIFIGILDTGFEWRKNPVLKGIKVINEYDFIGKDTLVSYDPDQEDTIYCGGTVFTYKEKDHYNQIDHGTAMLTLLGARMTGQYIGAAFNASFALAKTEMRSNPVTGDADIMNEEDWWIAGVEWLDSLGVEIISNSLGYKGWDTNGDGTVDYKFAYDSLDGKHYRMSQLASGLWEKGILLVTALGNRHNKDESPDTSIKAPADADSILTVGGVDTLGKWIRWETTGNISMGGIKGPRGDGARKPEVCGPWVGAYALPFPYPDYDSIPNPYEGHGTSDATAIVAGACALVLEAHPSWTAMQVRHAIMKTASLWASPNDSLGCGIVDAKKAIGTPEVIKPTFDRDKILTPYPSPFKLREGELTLPYLLVNNTFVRLRIYTSSGKLIWEKEIEDGIIGGPYYNIKWDGKSNGKFVASGIYLCSLTTGYGSDVKKFARALPGEIILINVKVQNPFILNLTFKL
ncbi:MAG: S8 family peptidase [Candidatus Stahlbacteria bacterium]|nr:S8 family peptidase [Candidatus Stahlbacteria bacterium]